MSAPPSAPSPKPRRGCFLYLFLAVLAAGVFVTIGIVGALWWLQRPISPVELTANESNALDQKIAELQQPESRYEAGTKHIVLTEREINGLINDHTDLGDKLRLEIDPDALNAHLALPIPEDSAILPGKQIKARARLELDMDGAQPVLTIADITIYGVSLPNAWLGGIKNRDLLRELVGNNPDSRVIIEGIDDLKLERERIEIMLSE